MTISERLFKIMEDKNISMPELSRMTGISRHTIFDWQRRNTNPGADKIMIICEALNISPEELLAGTCKETKFNYEKSFSPEGFEMQIINACQELSEDKKKRLLAYLNMLQNTKERKGNQNV